MGGRHPLCGIGVISRISIICRPAFCKLRITVSRPGPGPLIKILICLIPKSRQRFKTVSIAIFAANGVPFRAPLNPHEPADDQAIVSPFKFDNVISVLLKFDLI